MVGIQLYNQQQYSADQKALQTAKTDKAYKVDLTTLKSQFLAIQLPTMKVESSYVMCCKYTSY